MDDLRWILAIAGAVVVVATYLSGRFERDEWKRDRETISGQPGPSASGKVMPQFKIQDNDVKRQAPKPQQTDRKVSIGLNNEGDVNEALGVSEPVSSPAEEETEEPKSEWEGAIDSTREPLIEDEIVAVEIPPEFSEYAEERRSESRLKLKPEIEEPVQQELVLDVEPLVLVLTILAKDENQFSGGDIKKTLEAEDVNHGDMEIFHFHIESEKDAVFSVASVVEPGTFDLENINEYETPGLSLFCQLPGPAESTEAFNILLKKAQSIADSLGGHLCDDKRNQLTEQAIGHYRDRISAFDHEVVLARKKQE